MNYNFSERSKARLDELTNKVNAELERIKNTALDKAEKQSGIINAMWYSISAGGKRIRPALVLEFCRICGGDEEKALPAACALEMIHTFSLIHDDMPCMDDDDMRRGQPSCHKAYGEAAALLAGDALLNMAYEVICGGNNTAEVKIALISELSAATGVNGMIGGQVIDTLYDGKITEKLLLDMYGMKTGALLKSACRMGCIAAGAGKDQLCHADRYAERLGIAFQIKDDILDIYGNEKLLGKPVGSDEKSGKLTYASLNGVKSSSEMAEQLTNEALAELDAFRDNEFLRELTIYLLKRES